MGEILDKKKLYSNRVVMAGFGGKNGNHVICTLITETKRVRLFVFFPEVFFGLFVFFPRHDEGRRKL